MKKSLLVILGFLFIGLCGCSVRAGYGPYDTANYTDLDARSEIMEDKETSFDMEEYWDYLADQQATEDYSAYINDILMATYEMELHATEDAVQY